MDNILDISNLHLEGTFNEQVDKLFSLIRLTRDEVDHISDIYRDIVNVLCHKWPGCTVIPFGSVVTGLAIKTSDADCFVHTLDGYNSRDDIVKKIFYAKHLLSQKPSIFQKLFAITKARVPIIQFYHSPTNTSGDISLSGEIAVANSNLIRYLLTSDPRAFKLAILIKYWSKVHKITGTHLPNYALVMLVIFYLQQVDILPAVKFLQDQENEKRFINGWEVSFQEIRLEPSKNNMPLHQLFGGFFRYYTEFNFDEDFICPYLGCPVNKKIFLADAKYFHVYKSHLSNGYCLPLQTKRICVQDLFQHDRNCTVAVHDKLAATVNAHIHLAADIYDQDSGSYETLLMRVLSEQPDLPRAKIKVPPGRVMKRGRGAPQGQLRPLLGQERQSHRRIEGSRHTPAFRSRGPDSRSF